MSSSLAGAQPSTHEGPFDVARALALVTGDDAGDILHTAVRAAGGTLVRWRARQVQSSRHGTTAAYGAVVQWGGEARYETFVIATGDVPETALVLERGGERVAVWRVPHDPDLPGLAAASDPGAVADLLAELGLGSGSVQLVQRAYRPRRRSVIEAIGSRGRVFLKVVRPEHARPLHDRHRRLVANGVPVPDSLGWTAGGVVVLEALGGRTLRDAVRSGQQAPDGDDIVALLDLLPPGLAADRPRRSWLDTVGHYAAAVATIVPEERERVIDLAAVVRAEAGTGPLTAVHGDFYESQVLVDRGRITGLLDVDTMRLGDRLEDLGCLLGHLAVLAELDGAARRRIRRLGAGYVGAFDRHVDPADLRYRTAAVVISLATGPYRVQQSGWPDATRRLVGVAEQWIASARRQGRRATRGLDDERDLTYASSPSSRQTRPLST